MVAVAPNVGSNQASKAYNVRIYQQELFEEAKRRNVVAFLDTGAGKTMISILLIKDKADELSSGSSKKVTVFLAPKVDLVLQQASVLRIHTGLETKEYVGCMGVDFWKEAQWKEELEKRQLMVMTHQILLNCLQHGFIKYWSMTDCIEMRTAEGSLHPTLSFEQSKFITKEMSRTPFVKMEQINLLIFDECHHAKKKHPYNRIMLEFYFPLSRRRRPHIFGMTASPLDTKLGKVTRDPGSFIGELEAALDSKVLTVADRSLLEQVAPLPSSEVLEYELPDFATPVESALERLIMLGSNLREQGDEARRLRQKSALEMQGLARSRLDFDVEKIRTECHVFARHITSVVYTIKDMGPFAGGLCLLEVLKPAARSIYNGGLDSRQQQAISQAAVELLDSDLDLDDAWWDGHTVQYESAIRHDCTKGEIMALNTAMWGVIREMKGLLAPHAEDLYKPLPDEEAVQMRWPHICQQLKSATSAVMNAADWGALGRQLVLGPDCDQGEPGACPDMQLVSTKVSCLCQRLLACKDLALEHEAAGTDAGVKPWSCIVFCTRKSTCLALNWLMGNCGPLSFLHCSAVMGTGGREGATASLLKKQQGVLADFKAGKLNTLVATAVAEEGLDLTHCRLVVRFDLPATPLVFIQSRGRARARNSSMVLMVERGNEEQLALLAGVHSCEESMRAEAIARRLMDGSASDDDDDTESLMEGDGEKLGGGGPEDCYVVAATGAGVTISSAKSLLHHYCNKLPSDKYTLLQPRFSTECPQPGHFQTTVVLPNNCPVQRATGTLQYKKSTAVASACLAAIGLIHQAGGLTDSLLPDAGIQSQNRDAFAQFDECKVAAVVRDPSMPAKATLGSKAPDILSWPPPAAAVLASGQGTLTMHKYRVMMTSKIPELLPKAVSERLPELEQHIGLLVPKKLPDIPSVPMELLQSVVTTVDLNYLGQQEISVQDYEAAKAWHELMLAKSGGSKRRVGKLGGHTPATGAGTEPSMPSQDEAKRVKAAEEERPHPAATTGGASPDKAPAEAGAEGNDAVGRHQGGAEQHNQMPADSARLQESGPVPDSGKDAFETFALGSSGRVSQGALSAEALTGDSSVALDGAPSSGQYVQAALQALLTPEPEQPPKAGLQASRHLKLVQTGCPDTPAWYCLVPLLGLEASGSQEMIDWQSMKRVKLQQTAEEALDQCLANNTAFDEVFQGGVVTTPHNNLAYDVLSVEEGTSLDDVMPEVKSKLIGAKAKKEEGKAEAEALQTESLTYREYFKRRWKLDNLGDCKYMLKCTSKALLRRTEGATGKEIDYGEVTVLLPPRLCMVHGLKRKVILISKYLVRVMWWIHTLLLSTELRAKLTPPECPLPDVRLIAEAVTPSQCLQGFSYERLETLGDAFLKYDCCTHVFFTYPKAHEGQLAECKQAVISNRNLGVLGHVMGLAAYASLPAVKMDWATGREHERQKTTHKIVADCMEALIGAFYITGGEKGASAYMRHIGLLPKMPGTAYQLPEPDRSAASPSARKLEAMLGYKFRDLKLLKEACTHCSWPDQSAPCYQRLEFLGDAALDFLISRYYILGYRDIEPGKLHDLRSASVNNTRLAIISAWYKLHPYLRYFSTRLFGEIAAFVGSVKDAKKGKSAAQKRSSAYARRMEQFSSRDYKGQVQAIGDALRISTWAGQDPSTVKFPPSYSDQAEKADGKLYGHKQSRQHENAVSHEAGKKSTVPSDRKRRREDEGYAGQGEDNSANFSRSESPRKRSRGLPESMERKGHLPPPPPDSRRHHRREDVHQRQAHPRTGHQDRYGRSSYSSRPSGGCASYRNSDRRDVRSPQRSYGSEHRKAAIMDSRPRLPSSQKRKGYADAQSPEMQRPLKDDSPEKDTLNLYISAGFGEGIAAAPKVLGDLFESIAGAVYIDSGGNLEVLWKVLQPFLRPMVHPDNVPCHPVRAILELAQQNGLQASFRREECEEEGCFLMSTVVNGQVLGQCKSNISRDYARMMSAEEAVEKWTETLVKELQLLPQQGPAKAASAKQQAARDRTWGLKLSKKLEVGDVTALMPKTAPDSAALEKAAHRVLPDGRALPAADSAHLEALAAAEKFEQELTMGNHEGEGSQTEIQAQALPAATAPAAEQHTLEPSQAAEITKAAAVHDAQSSDEQNLAVAAGSTKEPGNCKVAADLALVQKEAQPVDAVQQAALKPVHACLKASAVQSLPGVTLQRSDGAEIDEGARSGSGAATALSQLSLLKARQMALASQAALNNISDRELKIPKEWLSKMLKR